ncbi:MAG: S1 RNA-binding domain-containing protein [Planctomycetota bacterium]
MVKKGDVLQCVVLSVDKEKKRIALGRKQLSADPWVEQIPSNYHVGDLLSGYVTKITNFGVFVKLGEDLEGLLHISEISRRPGCQPRGPAATRPEGRGARDPRRHRRAQDRPVLRALRFPGKREPSADPTGRQDLRRGEGAEGDPARVSP